MIGKKDSHMAEIAINYKNKKKYADMPSVGCYSDAVSALMSVWSDRIEHIEEFVLLCLNRANKVPLARMSTCVRTVCSSPDEHV